MKSKISHICISVLLTSLPWAAQAQKAVTASQSTADENQPAVVAPADTTFSAKDSLKLNSMLQVATKKPKRDWSTWRPDTKRAMWLAIVLPGAGQIYNRKYWKLPIIYGGFAGCAYALSWNGKMYKDYSQAYLDIMDSNPNTKSYEDLLPPNAQYNEEQLKNTLKRRKDSFRRFRDLSIFAFIGVYLISIIDAYVDAELSNFDISPDLSMKLEPTVIDNNSQFRSNSYKNKSVGLQCVLRF